MDQRRMLVALVLSAVVVFAYDRLVLSHYRRTQPVSSPSAPVPAQAPAPPAPEAPPGVDDALRAPVETAAEVVVETDDLIVHITTAGARLARVELKHFRRTVEPNSDLLALVEGGPILPGTLQLGSGASDAALPYRTDATSLKLGGTESGEVRLAADAPGGIHLEKRYHFSGNGYLFEILATVEGPAPASLGFVVSPRPREDPKADVHETAVILAEGSLKSTSLDSLTSAPETISNASWAGFADQYFMVAALPAVGTCPAALGASDAMPFVRIDVPVRDRIAHAGMYVGPKQGEALARAGHGLDRALDFGWFWFVAVPLLHALRALNRVLGNYGLTIIVLTTLVKLATIPLTQVTFRNMREMQKIQPQMQKLRERYKDDQTALQKELMELYRRHRVNPFSGCLPMLLQLPIFVGLYNTLMYAIELRHAPFLLWINDLSAPDRLWMHVFGHDIGIPVLTILMGASMLLQQWLTPAQGDPMQQRMMMFMPLIFTFMFINFPAGLVLYWLVNNVITIAQQYYMMRT